MSIPTLESFLKIPPIGFITIAESESKFQCARSSNKNRIDPRNISSALENYHMFDKKALEQAYSARIPLIKTCQMSSNDVMLTPPDSSFSILLWNEWKVKGLHGVYEFLKGHDPTSSSPITKAFIAVFSFMSGTVDRVSDVHRSITHYFYPHLALPINELIETYTTTRDWGRSWVRALNWHPNFDRLAIALNDDTIRIFVNGSDIVPIIRNTDQKFVSTLEWRPFLENELSVGVEKGLIVWNIDSSKTTSNKYVLHPVQAPVTSLCYSPDGNFLITSSASDSSFYLYDLRNLTTHPMHKLGGGIPLILWSPDQARILATSPSISFRIWEFGDKWKSSRWNAVSGPIEAACWSPCGKMLLFASENMLYLINFYRPDVGFIGEKEELAAMPIFNLTECHIGCEESDLLYKIGGKVLQLLWDSSGTRVVCLFEDCDLIPVFRVQIGGYNTLTAQGIIRGEDGEYPIAIALKNGFEEGALLTIAWSSGRFQYFPMIFAQLNRERNILHQENWNYGFGSPNRSFESFHSGNEVGNEEAGGSGDHQMIPDEDKDAGPSLAGSSSRPSSEDFNASNIRLFSTSM